MMIYDDIIWYRSAVSTLKANLSHQIKFFGKHLHKLYENAANDSMAKRANNITLQRPLASTP